MNVQLKIFPTQKEADAAVEKSASRVPLAVMQLDRQRHYIKRAGNVGIEPTYLCTDGRWRKYDLIPELPHSTAASTASGN